MTTICWIGATIIVILIIVAICQGIKESMKPTIVKYRIVELHYYNNENQPRITYICEKSVNNGPFKMITWETGYPGCDPMDGTLHYARFATLMDAVTCIGTTDYEFVVRGEES